MRGYSMVSGWGTSMQSLVVQALVMRQLGRLHPRHLLAAEYGLRQTDWSPRTIHTRQLWGGPTALAHGGHRPVLQVRDAARSWSVQHARLKSKKRSGYPAAQDEEDDEEDEDKSDDSDYDEVDPNLPKGYKDMEKHVHSFRFDGVMRAGLDIARNKIEDAFYQNKLRLNGQRLLKKSRAVKAGDTLDLVLSENNESGTVALMRVVLLKAGDEKSSSGSYKVSVRRWKSLELPRDEAFKQ